MHRADGDRPYDSSKLTLGDNETEDESPSLVEVDEALHHCQLRAPGQTERLERGDGACDNRVRSSVDVQTDGSERVDELRSTQSTRSGPDVGAVTKVESLGSGIVFANRYKIDGGRVYHRGHQQHATDVKTSKPVWLKFCLDAPAEWKNAIHMHEHLLKNRHICRLQNVLGGDRAGFPPCSVYAAGDCTLAETLAHGRLKIDQQRSILRAIAEALESMHRHGIVHGDVNPANIVWFASESAWKLANLEHACHAGEETTLSDSCNKYEAPEILQALTQGRNVIRRTPAQDIWSFGVLALEILTCSSSIPLALHRHGASPAQRMLSGGTVSYTEISAECSERSDNSAGVHRHFVEALLCEDPSERHTAKQILEDEFFRPAAGSSSTADPRPSRQLDDRNSREDIVQWPSMSWFAILSVGITKHLSVERFRKSSDPSEPFDQRAAKPALSFDDALLPDDPVHILRLEQDARLRFHLSINQAVSFVAVSVLAFRVQPPDEPPVDLKTVERRQGQGIEAIAHLLPSSFTSHRLHTISQRSDAVDRKYVKLSVHVRVLLDGPFRREVDYYQLVYVKIVRPRARLRLGKFFGKFQNRDPHNVNM